jgi:hypothetical protein
VYGVAAGACPFTSSKDSGSAPYRRIDLKRNVEFVTAERTPLSFTMAQSPSAGVSLDRQRSFRASRIHELISMVLPTSLVGGSLAFSSIGIIDERGLHPSPSERLCARSPGGGEVRWKAIRKKQKVGVYRHPFFTTEPFRCSSARASSDLVG